MGTSPIPVNANSLKQWADMAALTRRLLVTELDRQRDRSLDGYSSALAARFKQSDGSEHRAVGATFCGRPRGGRGTQTGRPHRLPLQPAMLKDLQSLQMS